MLSEVKSSDIVMMGLPTGTLKLVHIANGLRAVSVASNNLDLSSETQSHEAGLVQHWGSCGEHDQSISKQ